MSNCYWTIAIIVQLILMISTIKLYYLTTTNRPDGKLNKASKIGDHLLLPILILTMCSAGEFSFVFTHIQLGLHWIIAAIIAILITILTVLVLAITILINEIYFKIFLSLNVS